MNTPRRFRSAAALYGAATLAVSALTVLLPGAARAQTAVTDPVGYLSIALPANSDTFVSIPFTRPSEFTGAVASVDTTNSKITLGGTPGFTSGAFTPLATTAPNDGHKTYYVIIGPKNAALTPTLSVTNGSATVTATAAPEAVAGDTITVAGYTFTVTAANPTATPPTLTIDRVYPGTTASGLAATYDHSPSEGRFYTVTANDTGSLTVNLNGDSLSNVVAGTQVSVIPYWTLGTAFPASDAGKSFTASTSAKARGTQLLLPNVSGVGFNLAANVIYYFLTDSWRQAGADGTVSRNDDVLLPDSYFIARNANVAGGTFTPTGAVLVNRTTVPLTTQTSTQQDNSVAAIRPVDLTLNQLGLVSSGAFTPTTNPKSRQDQLFTYDNTQVLVNKPASAIYFYQNNAWRKAGEDASVDFGSTIVPSGSGLIIRKAATANGTTQFWQAARTYLN